MICSSAWRRVGCEAVDHSEKTWQVLVQDWPSSSLNPPTLFHVRHRRHGTKHPPFPKTTALGFSLLINPVWVLLCELCSPPSCMHSGKRHAKGIMSAGLQGNKDGEEKDLTVYHYHFSACKKNHIYMHGREKHNPDSLFTFSRTWPAGTVNSCVWACVCTQSACARAALDSGRSWHKVWWPNPKIKINKKSPPDWYTNTNPLIKTSARSFTLIMSNWPRPRRALTWRHDT